MKKSVVPQTFFPCLILCGGFEQIKAAFLYTLIRNAVLTLAGSAAYGGSRHEANSVFSKSENYHNKIEIMCHQVTHENLKDSSPHYSVLMGISI